MSDPCDAIVSQYLHRLELALAGVPADRREQIVEEIRAHIAEARTDLPIGSQAAVAELFEHLGSPEEIAREATAGEAMAGEAPAGEAPTRRRSWFATHGPPSAVGALLVVAVVGLMVVQLSGSSAAVGRKAAAPTASVGYDGPAICAPTTDAATSGGSPAALEASGTRVAGGTLEGQAWSLWAAKGKRGAAALEDGGVVFGGREYGLCPGYPNPSETEMIDTGQDAVVDGVVDYPGLAKVQISTGQINSFAVGTVLPAPHVEVVDGVSFYIGTLPRPACSYHFFEVNTTSPSYSAEHNVGFGGDGTNEGYRITSNPGNDGPCKAGKLDPLSYSEGIWQLPPGQFNARTGGGSGAANAPSSNSDCTPTTAAGTSGGSPASLEARATEVASGTVNGDSWSVWSAQGKSGATGLEDGGLVLNGAEYGLCPGYPNPAELEMINAGSNAIVYGVVGYRRLAKVQISTSRVNSFEVGTVLPSPQVQVVNGVSFFIGTLPKPACSYRALELNTTSPSYSAEHNLGFAGAGAGKGYPLGDNPGNSGGCVANKIDPISFSQGIWQTPPGHFPTGVGGGGGRAGAPTLTNGWLPASDVSGGGGADTSDCAPQTLEGSASASTLGADATEVASGSTDGHSWSVWSKNGQSGATGLEEGGVVIDGVAHGLCPGFPNPAEMELLEPSGGGDGIAFGVIGYPGSARVDVYQGTVETFDTGRLLASTTAQRVNGAGFFITALSESACDVSSVELNTASTSYAAEHNLGFSTSDCTDGQLVPISWSQGIWQLPTREFPNKFQAANGGGGGRPRRLAASGGAISTCDPPTNAATSGSAATTITATAAQVASGTVAGQPWTLWSKNGEKGSAALEDAGLVLDGKAYGLCPGFPNPAELEIVNPGAGSNGIVFGVSGYTGPATVKVSVGTVNTFNAGKLLLSQRGQPVDGTTFFIGELPGSACSYPSLELDVTARHNSSQHNLGFGSCTPDKLVQITGSMGGWSGP